jgi:hypothetical protein
MRGGREQSARGEAPRQRRVKRCVAVGSRRSIPRPAEPADRHPTNQAPTARFAGKIIPWAVSARPHARNRSQRRSPADDLQFVFPQVSDLIRTAADATGHRRRTSQPISRVLSVGVRPRSCTDRATIHLGLPLPTTSCGLPGSSGGQPSNAPCLTLLRVGFAEPPRSPWALVVSYTTVSPLPPVARRRSVFCGTFPRVTPGGCCPPPCPVEPGLSSASDSRSHSTRPPGRLVRRADSLAVLMPARIVRSATRHRP